MTQKLAAVELSTEMIPWENMRISLITAPAKFGTEVRLANCQALAAAEDFNNHGQYPNQQAEDWVMQMSGYDYHVWLNESKVFVASFHDGSYLVWIQPLAEWGFIYSKNITPFVPKVQTVTYALPGG